MSQASPTLESIPQSILFGLALGDSLGSLTEFLKLSQIKERYSSLGIQEPPMPALYTDDTQMTLALTEGVLDVGIDAPLDMLMNGIGNRFIQWAHSLENNRAPCLNCLKGIQNFESGMTWQESGVPSSRGCGAAIRVAPLGYFYQHDESRLREVTTASSLITHRHPTPIAASVGAACLVKLALDGVPINEYIPQTIAFCDGMSDDFTYALLRVGHVLGWVDEEAALDHIGRGWVGEETVALAVYCILRYPDDYVACVRRAANTNGDSDSIACIAGGIMGARLGLDAIPLDWRNRCENHLHLVELSVRMANANGN